MEEKMVERAELSEYSELRARIAKLGMTQSGLARRMQELGDPRDFHNILRSIQRQVAGTARFSGEMRALIGLMEEVQRGRVGADAPRGRAHAASDGVQEHG